MTGSELISAERLRQIEDERYTYGHDDIHVDGELAIAAAALAADGSGMYLQSPDQSIDAADPWGLVSKHAADRVRQLVIAGALIAAEIDRIQRAGVA